MRGLKKKLHLMAQTNTQTNGHGDSMTESAQRADSVKMALRVLSLSIYIPKKNVTHIK